MLIVILLLFAICIAICILITLEHKWRYRRLNPNINALSEYLDQNNLAVYRVAYIGKYLFGKPIEYTDTIYASKMLVEGDQTIFEINTTHPRVKFSKKVFDSNKLIRVSRVR